jgi:hypothetical protein
MPVTEIAELIRSDPRSVLGFNIEFEAFRKEFDADGTGKIDPSDLSGSAHQKMIALKNEVSKKISARLKSFDENGSESIDFALANEAAIKRTKTEADKLIDTSFIKSISAELTGDYTSKNGFAQGYVGWAEYSYDAGTIKVATSYGTIEMTTPLHHTHGTDAAWTGEGRSSGELPSTIYGGINIDQFSKQLAEKYFDDLVRRTNAELPSFRELNFDQDINGVTVDSKQMNLHNTGARVSAEY